MRIARGEDGISRRIMKLHDLFRSSIRSSMFRCCRRTLLVDTKAISNCLAMP